KDYLRLILFFFSSRRRHTRSKRDWSSDVCSSDLHLLLSRQVLRKVQHLPPQNEVPFSLSNFSLGSHPYYLSKYNEPSRYRNEQELLLQKRDHNTHHHSFKVNLRG